MKLRAQAVFFFYPLIWHVLSPDFTNFTPKDKTE